MRSGSLLRGEVLARWHDVVGTGRFMRGLESRISRVRDRLRAARDRRARAEARLQAAVRSSVDAVVHAAADRAAERAAAEWRAHPAGRALLAESRRLDSASPELLDRTREAVRAWQGYVFELVREEGPEAAAGRALRLARRQRRRARRDARGVPADRRPDRRGGRGRRRHVRGRPASARSDPRRPGGAHARGPRTRDLLQRVAWAARRGSGALTSALLAPAAPEPGAAASLREAVRGIERAR